eukprot:8969798-Alexandrium_andersonii.AAC.1
MVCVAAAELAQPTHPAWGSEPTRAPQGCRTAAAHGPARGSSAAAADDSSRSIGDSGMVANLRLKRLAGG